MVFENTSRAESADVFLDIRSQVSVKHNEEGLLALAFHPRYAQNGLFFVYYSTTEPRQTVLSRFSVAADDPRRADPGSEKIILRVDQPWGNHNGSTVAFGPDGYLYMSLGDGGAANDPKNAGQDLSTLLGKILRIDVDRQAGDGTYAIPPDNPFVDRAAARPEIWAYGLRNPWRMSFDRETGDLWAGDVGQVRWEEIDIITKGGNYGWRIREGKHAFMEGESTDPMIDPIVDHNRREAMSITGGHVYRGSRYPRLRGVYVYGDYITGRIWGIRAEGGRLVAHEEILDTRRRNHISSFGEDALGELYVCAFDRLDGRGSSKGRIYRIVAD
jgi:glucose/arabinose dehydrogenase